MCPIVLVNPSVLVSLLLLACWLLLDTPCLTWPGCLRQHDPLSWSVSQRSVSTSSGVLIRGAAAEAEQSSSAEKGVIICRTKAQQ